MLQRGVFSTYSIVYFIKMSYLVCQKNDILCLPKVEFLSAVPP